MDALEDEGLPQEYSGLMCKTYHNVEHDLLPTTEMGPAEMEEIIEPEALCCVDGFIDDVWPK